MIVAIVKTERGLPIGMMRREFNNAMKDAYASTADEFHRKFTHRRFTPEHARRAGYKRRKGEGLPRGSKRFRRSYFGRKLRGEQGGGVGQALPLVKSGASRRRSRRPRIRATNKRARITFTMPALNFRHPKSQIDMRDEFNRVLPDEQKQAAAAFEQFAESAIARVQMTKRTELRAR